MSISWFEDHGITFNRATDDMDAYQFAAFKFPDSGWFVIMRYLNEAPQSSTFMLERRIDPVEEYQTVIREIAQSFGLRSSDFRWRDPQTSA